MLLLLLRLLARLPLPALHMLGRAAGRLIYALPGKYRERLRANTAQAGYDDPAFARRAAAQTGAMILESPRIWFRNDASLKQVVCDDEYIVDDARQEGRALLMLTPHLGSFEITARYFARKRPVTVMFRPPRKPWLAPAMEAARNTSGVSTVPATSQGVRAFVRILRDKETVGMLPDQAPSQGEGVWAPFFGRLAYTVTLPGKLARNSNAIVILTAAERLPGGKGWRIHHARVPEPLPESAEAQAALINQEMEKLIRRFPEQYLWGYNRYKVPRGAPPPEASAADASA